MGTTYDILQLFHTSLRWFVLLTLILIVIFSIIDKKSLKTKNLNLSTLIAVIAVDIQFILGLLLYAIYSPKTQIAFDNFGGAMKNSDLRSVAIEHPVLMILALIFVHIGRKKFKTTAIERKHHKTMIFFLVALVLVVLGLDRVDGLY